MRQTAQVGKSAKKRPTGLLQLPLIVLGVLKAVLLLVILTNNHCQLPVW
jgi:hypothetical protein